MTRREMLQILSVLSFGLSVPGKIAAATPAKQTVKIIGIGSMGCGTAEYFQKKKFPAEYIHFNYQEWLNKDVSVAAHAYYIEDVEKLYNRLYFGAYDKSLSQEIKSIISSNSQVIVAVKPGEKRLTKFTLALISYLNLSRIEYFSIIYLPYGFEGTLKDKRAQSVVGAIKSPDKSDVLDLRVWTTKYGKLEISDAIEAIYHDAYINFIHNPFLLTL